jgi:cytidyltransferase-like protein
MEDRDKTCLISGRFDRLHPGHIRTIQLLGQKYKKVLIVVLDHSKQKYPVCYRAQMIREIFQNCKGEYEVVVNRYHFGQISIDELFKFEFNVYAAGNLDVLKHIEEIYYTSPSAIEKREIEIIYVERPYGYDSSTERLGATVKEMQ